MAIELTPAQLHQYKEEGYVVVRNLIPAADMVAVRDMLHQIEECDVDLPPRSRPVSRQGPGDQL
jgi:hypothetical protein